MAKGMYDAWAALKSGLEGINGSTGGYWLSFGTARVFSTLVLPDESAEMPDHYLCIPCADDTDRPEEQDQRSLKRFWTQSIFGFVRDTRMHPTDNGSVERILKMHDDLTKYLLDNPTLGGTVKNVALLPGVHAAGASDSENYGELWFPIEIEQFIDSSDIGSAA